MAALLAAGAAASLGGCVDLPKVTPFTSGPVDSRSSVANEVAEAARSPGPYPHFSEIPPAPKDVRPGEAWRSAVINTWALKRATEREAANLSFTLANTEAWAQTERARIPPKEMTPPPAGSTEATEAYAQSQRERATPPPAPH
ncbi:MAG: hypothetical protein P4L64_01240 [Caulobacteraceae bacterium]|nr:hypothetical protein [Caulobacteraceae bacterium]